MSNLDRIYNEIGMSPLGEKLTSIDFCQCLVNLRELNFNNDYFEFRIDDLLMLNNCKHLKKLKLSQKTVNESIYWIRFEQDKNFDFDDFKSTKLNYSIV